MGKRGFAAFDLKSVHASERAHMLGCSESEECLLRSVSSLKKTLDCKGRHYCLANKRCFRLEEAGSWESVIRADCRRTGAGVGGGLGLSPVLLSCFSQLCPRSW